MDDLAARLEAAPEGSRELSDEVLLACGWQRMRGTTLDWWVPPGEGDIEEDGQQPSPTESETDAFALMPADWTQGTLSWPGYDNGKLISKARADLHHDSSSGGGPKVKAFAATRALALSAALVKAKERKT